MYKNIFWFLFYTGVISIILCFVVIATLGNVPLISLFGYAGLMSWVACLFIAPVVLTELQYSDEGKQYKSKRKNDWN